MMDQAPKNEHYKKCAIEPITYIEANGWGPEFYLGNIIKYVTRYKHKNGVEDLIKARDYLDRLIKLEEKG
jgi:hypothetical protein